MPRELYTLVIPANAQTVSRSEIKRNLATHGLLDDSSSAVESLSLEPGEQALVGQFRGKYASMMAAEVEELFDAGNISSVSFFDPIGSKNDGYYSLKNVDVEPIDPNLDSVQKFDGVLTKEGTRESKRRAVETNAYQPENDFGNQQTAYVGVPAAATDVAWYNAETTATEPASVVETRTAEHGDVDVVDAQASSFDSPALVFDLPYQQEGKVDAVVWDDHDRAKLDADGINAWQWVFSTGHEFAGKPVVDNGLVRVHLDTSGLVVEEWDASAGAWSTVALGDSSWELDEWSLTRIGPARVEGHCRFVDPTQDPPADYSLDMSLKRGRWWPQWTRLTPDHDPTPGGLQTLLDPVADESVIDPQAEQSLVSRSALHE
jgi:hypothetical protein